MPFILLISFLPFCIAGINHTYTIVVEFKDAKTGDKIYLQVYHGKTLTNIDSLSFSNNEQAFQGNVSLESGMYALAGRDVRVRCCGFANRGFLTVNL